MNHDLLIRCSSVGRLMTEPKTLKEGPLSVGAKTAIRELAAQAIFGVDFEVSAKVLEKGIEVEPESIALLNQVRGLALVKNTERRRDEFITGECDLFDPLRQCGHDVKSSWSVATFPIATVDCEDKLYEWQMRGYMRLWNAPCWEVNYCLVDTPTSLIGPFDPLPLHVVNHIAPELRLTTWVVERDMEKEAAMVEKVRHARTYYAQVLAEFDATHRTAAEPPPWVESPAPAPTTKAAELLAPTF